MSAQKSNNVNVSQKQASRKAPTTGTVCLRKKASSTAVDWKTVDFFPFKDVSEVKVLYVVSGEMVAIGFQRGICERTGSPLLYKTHLHLQGIRAPVVRRGFNYPQVFTDLARDSKAHLTNLLGNIKERKFGVSIEGWNSSSSAKNYPGSVRGYLTIVREGVEQDVSSLMYNDGFAVEYRSFMTVSDMLVAFGEEPQQLSNGKGGHGKDRSPKANIEVVYEESEEEVDDEDAEEVESPPEPATTLTPSDNWAEQQ